MASSQKKRKAENCARKPPTQSRRPNHPLKNLNATIRERRKPTHTGSERAQPKKMATATALSLSGGGSLLRKPPASTAYAVVRCCAAVPRSRQRPPRRLAASRADDSSPAPFEMTVESALKLLGVDEGASFDDILRAKNAVLASCKDDQDAVAKVPETSPPLFPFAFAFSWAQGNGRFFKGSLSIPMSR